MSSITVNLGSCTVFWDADLGMSKDKLAKLRYGSSAKDKAEGERIGTEVEDWLQKNTHHDFRMHEKGVWFVDSSDAILFKLAFSGKFDDWA